MTKEDVIIQGLQNEMKKANEEIQKQDKKLKEACEEIGELELVNETFTETIENLHKKLADKDGLIGQLKDQIKGPEVERKKRALVNFLDAIMLKVLNDEEGQEIVKFIITEKKGIL